MMRFEPRLYIDSETAGQIEAMLLPLLESTTVVTDVHSVVLAAEHVAELVWVRAAAGQEMTYFLTKGDVPNADDFRWPGDPAPPDWREVERQETQNSEVQLVKTCQLEGIALKVR